MPSIDQIAGPIGAIVVLVAAVGFLVRVLNLLWTDHRASDERERSRTTAAEARLDAALAGLKEHTYVADKAVALAQEAVSRLERSGGHA